MSYRGRLVQIPADLVEFFWPQAEPWLSAAEHRIGCAPPHEFLARLLRDECDLWLIYAGDSVAAAGITSVRRGVVPGPEEGDPDTVGSILTIEALGGDGIRWGAVLADLEHLAREHGKTHVEIQGRPGWARLFRDDGYRTTYVTIRKAL